MPSGLRSLRHVIRPGPARAFPVRAPGLGVLFPFPPPAQAAREEPERRVWSPTQRWSCGFLACAASSVPRPPAAEPGRPPSPSWVMHTNISTE